MKKIVPVGLTSNVYQKVYSIIFLLHIYIILNTINSLFFAGFQFQTKLKTPPFRRLNIKSLIRSSVPLLGFLHDRGVDFYIIRAFVG